MSALATPANTLAFLQTPSIPYDVPADAVNDAKGRYASSWLRTFGYSPNARAPVAGTTPPRYVYDGILNLRERGQGA
jgi:hypothetical protein